MMNHDAPCRKEVVGWQLVDLFVKGLQLRPVHHVPPHIARVRIALIQGYLAHDEHPLP